MAVKKASSRSRKKSPSRKKAVRRKTATKKKVARKKTASKKKAATRKRVSKKKPARKKAGKKKPARKKAGSTKKKPARKKAPSRKKTSKKTPRKKVAKKSTRKKATRKKAVRKKPASKKKAVRKKKAVSKKKPVSRKKAVSKKKATSRKKTAVRSKKIAVRKRVPVRRPVAAKAPARPARSRKDVMSGPIHGIKPYKPKRGEKYMSDKQVEHFRNILGAWKRELIFEVDRTVHHMQDEAANFPDPNDRATQESEFGLELRTRDRERKLLRKIDAALARLDEGTYGYCDETGEEIGLKRLEARPVATLCLEAQERRELAERQFRDRDDRYR